jgi:hypothetical protein
VGNDWLSSAARVLVGLLVMTAPLLSPGMALAVQAIVDGDAWTNSGNKNSNNNNADLHVSPTQTTYMSFGLSSLLAGTTAAQIQKASITFT